MIMQNIDGKSRFHSTNQDYLKYSQRSICKAVEKDTMIQDDANLVEGFVFETTSTKHISASRAFKLTCTLTSWRKYIGPYRENSIADLHRGIYTLKSTPRENGQLYAQNTIADYVRILKRFYKWMIKRGYSSIKEEDISAIENPPGNTMTKTAAQMLSEEDVQKLLGACQNSRDRAIFSVLYESGCRIGELAHLKWDSVQVTDWNVVLNVNFKTGIPRKIPLIMSRPFLLQWRQDYPGEVKDDGWVFISLSNHQQLKYQALDKQLQILVARAGLSKKVTFHLFRHSRITNLLNQGMHEAKLKKMMWGHVETPMLETYGHITNKDVEDELARLYGIKRRREKNESHLVPQQCTRCAEINIPGASFCVSCGMPLKEEAKMKVENVQTVLNQLSKQQIVELLTRSIAYDESPI